MRLLPSRRYRNRPVARASFTGRCTRRCNDDLPFPRYRFHDDTIRRFVIGLSRRLLRAIYRASDRATPDPRLLI